MIQNPLTAMMETIQVQGPISHQQPTKALINTIGIESHESQPKESDAMHNKDSSSQHVDENHKSHQGNCIVKDDSRPAVHIVRRVFRDFVLLVGKKTESILAQETRDKPWTKSFLPTEDFHYDQILEALGGISEYCLPSLLTSLIAWYRHQLTLDEHFQKRPTSLVDQQHASDQQQSECGSPCTDTLASNLSIRSPTPSSLDATSNQVSITSTLPLEYLSPSLTLTSESHHSAANTSTSTATNMSSNSSTEDSATTIKSLELVRTRKLLIEFAFCQALIEIFNQLHLHPGHEDLIAQIEDIAFGHFEFVQKTEFDSQTALNLNQLADKYAEVIGVLARTRFKSVRKRFLSELNELRARESTPNNIQSIVTLLSSMKFFRVKMAPIEEFEASLQFLQECADYFLEVRHKSIKHALAGLFVEIMVPLSATVKNEVKIPCLKNFVDSLWTQTLDMCARKKHSNTLLPLVTCLLCVSQRSFFLTNWGVFLSMCLSNLKNRDQKMCRIALECLYRLIWIYMIRIKCESNNVTQARLHSIVDALFPRGSRTVVPRDSPLDIFVDIVHFIAQERLDFAMRHIIFDLLSVDRGFKIIIAPERMNIALQAFLAIADGLQQKEGEPPIPKPFGIASNTENSNSMRRAQTNKMLNDDTAKSIGLSPYHSHIRKSFNDILKALDSQYGRPLLLTATSNTNKEPDDVITSERRPKIELFKTCLAAIPRLMPDGMSKTELIDLLSRMTVHIDEEMRKHAFSSLQLLITEFVDWRLDAIEGFTLFLVNQIDESLRHLVDNALKMLFQLLISWRSAITIGSNPANTSEQAKCSPVKIQTGYETISSRHGGTGGQIAARKHRALTEMRLIQSELTNSRFDKLVSVVQKVEGASLVMLCSYHQPTRKLASQILRECRSILKIYTTWTCMEQMSFKTPEDAEDEDLSSSLKGSLSADNLSRVTATSASGPALSSATSMNVQAILSTSVSKICISNQNHQHDPYDSDIENNLADCFTNEDNSVLLFWIAVIMLESDNEQEYILALRLLKKILPNLPFEQAEFVEELERNLVQMGWDNFPGVFALVLKGCLSSSTYDLTIALLDNLTPILSLPICSGNQPDSHFPSHVIVLLTYLLASYDDPTPANLNIARRLAIWCDENSQKLDNLATVMTLYSRRSFSKDAFQWTKCVVKYLYDAYPRALPNVIPLLVDMLESGPEQVQRLIAPIIYCILGYVDINSLNGPAATSVDVARIYNLYLGSGQWRDAIQIFKLIISRSSYLANSTSHGRELPGRTMDLTIDVESLPVIAKGRLFELTTEQMLEPQCQETERATVPDQDASLTPSNRLNSLDFRQQELTGAGSCEQTNEQSRWRKSWLANRIIRQRLVNLLMP